MALSAAAILDTLDRSAEAFVFPMLDNGYVYPAAARMSLFRSPADWAIVIETFGFSPRSGAPDLVVTTIGSTVRHARPAGYDDAQFAAHVAANPNWTSRFFWPIEEGPAVRDDDAEVIDGCATGFRLRRLTRPMPAVERYDAAGIRCENAGEVRVYEWARVLANDHREAVLASQQERTAALPPALALLLTLDDWQHPDLAGSQRPSDVEEFVALAAVLEHGDKTRHVPGRGNTHWSHWPDGGTL